ncbi:MAG: hypothetical protein KC656_34515, partial [Myxococcales bacterium]|nr:hypothetical protein [Myxococcales bacterium]
YRPLTPEAAVTTDPDLIVLTTRGLQQLGGVEGVRALPSLGMTTAAREGRVVAVDDIQLLAFGLGTCAGATALRAGL